MFETIRLSLRNILRHKLRSAMTLAAIVMGVAGLIISGGFVQDIFRQLGEAIIHSQTGHAQIAKPDFFGSGSRRPEAFLIENPQALKQKIAQVAQTQLVMGRLNFPALLNNGRTDFAVIGEGIEPDAETQLGSFVEFIAGRPLSDKDQSGIVLGEGVAQALKLVPGDTITLLSQTPEGAMNTLDFELIGVFRSFSKDYDARAVRIPLSAAQELISTSGVNVLVVALHRTEDTDTAVHAINALLPPDLSLRRWDELSDFYHKTVELYGRQFGVLQLIVLIMVLLSVSNTVNMTVFERQGEFGTMRALGNGRKRVFSLVVLETTLIGLIGAFLGVCTGIGLAFVISAIGIPMPPPPNSNAPYTALILVVPNVVVVAGAVGVIAAVFASLFPAWRIARLPIVDALRHNI